MTTRWFYTERKVNNTARIITSLIGRGPGSIHHLNLFLPFDKLEELNTLCVYDKYMFRRKGSNLQYKHVDKTRWLKVKPY